MFVQDIEGRLTLIDGNELLCSLRTIRYQLTIHETQAGETDAD